jgi:hypothetical protein
MATEPGYGEPFRDKSPDCWCRYPWKLLDTGTEHATDCPAHERICRERAATATPATPFPVGSKVLVRAVPNTGVSGIVLGVAGDERWVQVGRAGSRRFMTQVYPVAQLMSAEPEPDPAGDVEAIATGVAGRGRERSR